MSTHRARLSRRAAEQILDHRGDPTEPVATLIDAAAAATSAGAGEDRAVALFREAISLGPVPISEGGSAMSRMTRKIAALPVAALAAGALLLSGGGLALAATQGALNVPFTGHDNRSDKAPDAPSSTNPGLDRTPGGPASTPGGSATHLPSGTPSPSLDGLCRAYQAGAMPRKATNPAFAALSAAAGGAEGVSAYCTDRIGAPSKPAHPTEGASPTIPPHPHPTQAASPTIPPRPTQAAH